RSRQQNQVAGTRPNAGSRERGEHGQQEKQEWPVFHTMKVRRGPFRNATLHRRGTERLERVTVNAGTVWVERHNEQVENNHPGQSREPFIGDSSVVKSSLQSLTCESDHKKRNSERKARMKVYPQKGNRHRPEQ